MKVDHLKFRIYDFKGVPQSYWLVDQENVDLSYVDEVDGISMEASQYRALVSRSKKVVIGSSEEEAISVDGLDSLDDINVYRFREVSENEFNQSLATISNDSDSILAFAVCKLTEGDLNFAKKLLYSSWANDLLEKHMKALSSSQVEEMLSDAKKYLFHDGITPKPFCVPDPINNGTLLSDVINILEANKGDILIDLESLNSVYKSKGPKKIPGVITCDGNVVKPWLEVKHEDSKWAKIAAFEVNRKNASMSILIERPVKLVKENGEAIVEVAGIKLDCLKTFKAYTLISDGEVFIPSIKVKINSVKAYHDIKKLGVIDTAFSTDAEYLLSFNGLALSPYDLVVDPNSLNEAYRQVLEDKVLISILSAVTKKHSDYTVEQIKELKEHYLTKNLNVNIPMVLDPSSVDKEEVVHSKEVEVGDVKILNSGRLKSANEFLDRHFVAIDVKSGMTVKDKPNFDMFFNPKYSFSPKVLSSKVKITDVDLFCKPIFEDFLGDSDNGVLQKILDRAGVKRSIWDLVRAGEKEMIIALDLVEKHQETIYREKISPVVFFISVTGMIPNGLSPKLESPDSLESMVPGLSLSKSEREGVFSITGDLVIRVYSER